jgi:hypothetical protein
LSARSWRRGFLESLDAVLALLEHLVDDGDHGGVVQLDALVDLALLHGRGQQRMVPRRSLSLARMAAFMSSVMRSLRLMVCSGIWE